MAALTAVALVLAGCHAQRPRTSASFAANGVDVTVVLAAKADGTQEVEATFSPQEPGFHLYSIDLPPEGIDGLGIRTVVTVRGGLSATGRPTADAAVRTLRPAGLDVDLPVYPDGPVTVTLPVRRTGTDHAEVLVSYAACSETRCLPPVTDHAIPLDLG
jgi:hypothetical protein